nr:MAG TPA: hypothetical protein [Caudoviricetes sp.]
MTYLITHKVNMIIEILNIINLILKYVSIVFHPLSRY